MDRTGISPWLEPQLEKLLTFPVARDRTVLVIMGDDNYRKNTVLINDPNFN